TRAWRRLAVRRTVRRAARLLAALEHDTPERVVAAVEPEHLSAAGVDRQNDATRLGVAVQPIDDDAITGNAESRRVAVEVTGERAAVRRGAELTGTLVGGEHWPASVSIREAAGGPLEQVDTSRVAGPRKHVRREGDQCRTGAAECVGRRLVDLRREPFRVVEPALAVGANAADAHAPPAAS